MNLQAWLLGVCVNVRSWSGMPEQPSPSAERGWTKGEVLILAGQDHMRLALLLHPRVASGDVCTVRETCGAPIRTIS